MYSINRMNLNPGDIVRGRYQIIKSLGHGGFGTTYKAYDNHNSANPPIVAIKRIQISQTNSNDEAVRDGKYIERLELEANTLRDLEHSCIPKFFESFTEENYYYIVKEYIEGHDLSVEIRPGQPIEEAAVVNILREVLEILQFVHQNNIIHRDLKPANIIRRRSNHKLVLIDFGAVKEVATEHTDAAGKTLTANIHTPGYAPPEQLAGVPNFNSDIYALGIIAMRGVTGFAIEAIEECERIPERDSQCNYIWEEHAPQINPKYKRIISRMIKYNFRDDRYQNINEVIGDLEKPVSMRSIPVQSLGIGLIGIILGVLLTEMLSDISLKNYEETKINFERVCNSEVVKGQELQKYVGTPKYADVDHQPVWPVFRWKCHLQNQKGDIKLKGINLNDYCQEKYENLEHKYEAYFKNHLNPNSWYCTNVGTKLESN